MHIFRSQYQWFFVSCLAVLVGGFFVYSSAPAFAFSGGSGTSDDPYQITDCVELQSISTNSLDSFQLQNSIDCSDTENWNGGQGFDPIDGFRGFFDGQGYAINNLTINRPLEDSVGLFGEFYGTVVDVGINGSITGSNYVGGLVARTANGSTVLGAEVDVEVVGNDNVGGIVGMLNYGTIEKNAFFGAVTSNNKAGGIVGYYAYGGNLHDNYFDGGTIAGVIAGGILGGFEAGGVDKNVYNNWARGVVTSSVSAGGIIGQVISGGSYLSITDNFAAVMVTGAGSLGGILGHNDGTDQPVVIDNSYFDTNLGVSDCVGSNDGIVDETGCMSWDSSVSSTYLVATSTTEPVDAWDFDTVWEIGIDYPVLQEVGPFGAPSVVTNLEGSVFGGPLDIDLTWDAPTSTGNLPLIEYEVEMRRTNDSWDESFGSWTNSDPSFSRSVNFYDTDYTYRVRAINGYGASDWVEIEVSSESNTVVEIDTCEELRDIDLIADGQYDTYRLINNIDCDGVDFNTIGYGEVAWTNFFGVLDGDGYTIFNLEIAAEENYTGLFYALSEGAVVRDLTLSGGSVAGLNYVGALAGLMEDALIENVSSDLSVVGSNYVGGLVGDMYFEEFTEITNSWSTGDVSASDSSAGGLIGRIDASYAGSAFVKESYATGNVTSTAGSAGGLIGYIETYPEDDDVLLTIKQTYASGDVYSGDQFAGGLIGRIYNESYYEIIFSLEDSYATGNVESVSSYAGGLIGGVYMYDDGDLNSSTIRRVYASGSVTGGPDYIGGLFGYVNDPDDNDVVTAIRDSFAVGLVTQTGGEGTSGGVFGVVVEGDSTSINNMWFASSTGREACDSAFYVEECTRVEDETDFYDVANEPFDTGVWDDENVWYFSSSTYPTLRAFEDIVTEAPTLLSPEASTGYLRSEGMEITFILPELPLANSISLTFIPEEGDTVTMTLDDAAPEVENTFVLYPYNLSLAEEVSAASANKLYAGSYTVVLSYQDVYGNSAATASAINVDITTPSPDEEGLPTVQSTSPVDNATSVAIDQEITVVFSEPMTTSTVSISASPCDGECPTPSISSWSEDLTTATIVNGEDYDYSTEYTFVLDGDDASGYTMEDEYSFSFTTAAATRSGGGGGGFLFMTKKSPISPTSTTSPVVSTTTPPEKPVVSQPDIAIPENGLKCDANVYLKTPVKLGATNNPDDVKLLEQFLNTYEGTNLVVNGIYETVDFNAVVKWQEKYASDILAPWGMVKGSGYVYTTSLKKIKEIHEKNCATAAPVAPTQSTMPVSASCLNTETTLTQGMTGALVTTAQTLLQKLNYFTVTPTGFYGPVTTASVRAFQAANGIDSVGYIGPQTRSKLNELGCR
jgi:hypothetical protein